MTDLEYVKKERDRALKLLEKKSQKRKKSRLGEQMLHGDAKGDDWDDWDDLDGVWPSTSWIF